MGGQEWESQTWLSYDQCLLRLDRMMMREIKAHEQTMKCSRC